MGTTTTPGIFLGWKLHPGGKWSGDDLCSPLCDWDGAKTHGKKVRVIRTKVVDFDPNLPVEFPLRAIQDQVDRKVHAPKAEVCDLSVETSVDKDEPEPNLLGITLRPVKSLCDRVEPVDDQSDAEGDPSPDSEPEAGDPVPAPEAPPDDTAGSVDAPSPPPAKPRGGPMNAEPTSVDPTTGTPSCGTS